MCQNSGAPIKTRRGYKIMTKKKTKKIKITDEDLEAFTKDLEALI